MVNDRINLNRTFKGEDLKDYRNQLKLNNIDILKQIKKK